MTALTNSPASRPGDPAVGPAGNDDVGVAVQAGRPVTAFQGGWSVGTVQQAGEVETLHGWASTITGTSVSSSAGSNHSPYTRRP